MNVPWKNLYVRHSDLQAHLLRLWTQSSYSQKVDVDVNVLPSGVLDQCIIYILSDITPPDIKKEIAADIETHY